MLYIISNVASSYKYIRKYCLFHCIRKVSISTGLNNNDKIYGDLFKINMELGLTKENCYDIPAKTLLKDVNFFKQAGDDLSKNLLKVVLQKIKNSLHIDNNYKIEVENNFKDYLPFVNNKSNHDNKTIQ